MLIRTIIKKLNRDIEMQLRTDTRGWWLHFFVVLRTVILGVGYQNSQMHFQHIGLEVQQ